MDSRPYPPLDTQLLLKYAEALDEVIDTTGFSVLLDWLDRSVYVLNREGIRNRTRSRDYWLGASEALEILQDDLRGLVTEHRRRQEEVEEAGGVPTRRSAPAGYAQAAETRQQPPSPAPIGSPDGPRAGGEPSPLEKRRQRPQGSTEDGGGPGLAE